MHSSLLLTSLLACCAGAQKIFNLSDVDWTVSNGHNVTVPGKLPSQAHLDLLAEGVIDDPLFGSNDVNYRWIERSNWTYTSGAIEGLSRNKKTETWLIFEGLDTFVEIKLCNKTVANVANQFRQFTFEVSDILAECKGDPSLSLNFGSAAKIVLELAKTGPDYINQVNNVKGNEFDGKIYMRKEQNDFGWDWGPAMAPAGPWKPAYIVQRARKDPVHIHNTLIDIYRKGQMNNLSPDQSQPFVFNASVDFLGTLGKDAEMHLKLVDSSGKTVKNTKLGKLSRNDNTITGSTIIKDPVDLWWPNGFGEQNLYTATVSITCDGTKKPATVTKRVGFRTIVLNLNPITGEQEAAGVAPGSNWHFEINGHEMYAKGANLIPPDSFWPRVNETKIQELFDLAVLGRYNMLRVWSSGAYLPDWIYDMADEMGILLWSEFEFSDAEYPILPDWMETYEAEAYYNVRRVNHHPSLALWAGGNELEAIILNFFWGWEEVMDGYQELFEKLLIKCVYANSRSISYIPSSTYNGYTDLDFDSTRPQTSRYKNSSGPDHLYANTDLYIYDGSQAFNESSYPLGRFATEFGFISMPSIQSWREAVPENELSLDSPGVVHHNRHTPFGAEGSQEDLSKAGIADMTNAVKLWYPVPDLKDQAANFSAWSWTTQLFQADYYAEQMAFYRRGSAQRERQLGCLYWQLNDLWVAPTWSTIEASGRAKMSYYAAKDIFTPVIIRPFYDEEADSMEVWVVSDEWDATSGTATLEWTDWKGKALNVKAPKGSHIRKDGKGCSKIPFEVGAINGTKIASYPDVSTLFSKKMPAKDALLHLTVKTKKGETHSSYFHPATLLDSALRNPGLKLKSHSAGYGKKNVQFTVKATKAVAAWVWLDHPSTVRGFFEDNGFWLNKGESRTVSFEVWNDWTGDGSWVDDVEVRSLWDNKS